MRNGMKMLLMDNARSNDTRNRGNEYNGTYNVNVEGTRMEDTEMRRRRDSRGRYMEGGEGAEMRGNYNAMDYDAPESRFRDRRGREHYDNGRYAPRGERHDQDTSTWDYSPEERRANLYALPRNERGQNQIGFMGTDERKMNHGEYREHERRMGRAEGMRHFDHEMAKEWTAEMKNADGTTGAHWKMEQVKPYMAQAGFKGDEMEFWVMMNAMYSDYCAVLKKFAVDRPEVYAALAKAWLEDKDAVEDKAAMYYEYIVEHE